MAVLTFGLTGCGDDAAPNDTLEGSRTSPSERYVAEQREHEGVWYSDPEIRSIWLKNNSSGQKVKLWSDTARAGNNFVFIWDDDTHLTIRSTFGQDSTGPVEVVRSALGVTISYLPSGNSISEALRVGRATFEYNPAVSDVEATVDIDRPGQPNVERGGDCEIAFEISPAGRFEKVGLVLRAARNSRRGAALKREAIGVDFAYFWLGKMANGSYRNAALTYAFLEDVPLRQQFGTRVFGDEQSIFVDQYPDEDRTMEKEWPKRLADDRLRFRYVFDFAGESVSYSMPLSGVRGELDRFRKCVQD